MQRPERGTLSGYSREHVEEIVVERASRSSRVHEEHVPLIQHLQRTSEFPPIRLGAARRLPKDPVGPGSLQGGDLVFRRP
jgi:hypothetical protein